MPSRFSASGGRTPDLVEMEGMEGCVGGGLGCEKASVAARGIGGTTEREEDGARPAAGLLAPSRRAAKSARAQAQLERPRDVAEPGAERRQVDVLGRPQRLQREVLQDGGEVEEELHARQRLAQAHSATCGGGKVAEER